MKAVLFSITLFFSFLIEFQNLIAQETPVKIKTFKMPRFPIADIPKKSIAVSDIHVIQMVSDSIRLGYAGKGLNNHIVMLKPVKPLTEFLQEHIINMYKNDFKKNGAHILWVIKELRVGEKSTLTEYAYTRFNTDAYISKEGILYKLVCSIDTVFVTESKGDVTAWHGEDIESAFKVLLKKTLQSAKSMAEQPDNGITIEQIQKETNPKNTYLYLMMIIMKKVLTQPSLNFCRINLLENKYV